MYSRHQAAILKEAFWTSFGQYMAPVPAAAGLKINWVNYKTGIKDIHFKLQADQQAAIISIELSHTDPARQAFFFDKLMQVKSLLWQALQEEWQWVLQTPDENGKITSRVFATLTGVNILRKEDWPSIISFFKPRIIALDRFWLEARFILEDF